MRIRKGRVTLGQADLTPMIDMTFQLIAFFMVLINFSEADQNQLITLPTSELAKPPDAPFDHPIFIHLQKEGRVLIGAESIPFSGLRTHLGREVTFLRLKEQTAADATVIIRADANAKTGDVQKVIQTCQELKFERFALRAEEEIE